MTTVASPLSFAADMLDPNASDWTPLPHQIPPAGKWFIWMLLGGRGAGKTATAARYMHDHVFGPPCLPDVPGGHWPSIIAPTLGDGVTSCVNGPSGLRAHCPEVKVRQTAGGTSVRWPNGVEAKIFGAHTPEDVERLRSGGNRCFAAGTRLLTEHGQQRVETIVPGTKLWTPIGWVACNKAGKTGTNEQLWEVEFSNGAKVITNGAHRWPTFQGVQTTADLRVGSILETCALTHQFMKSPMTELSGNDSQNPNTSSQDVDSYTSTSTSSTTDPSLVDTKFTMWMKMRSTMILKIFRRLRRRNIEHTTLPNYPKNGIRKAVLPRSGRESGNLFVRFVKKYSQLSERIAKPVAASHVETKDSELNVGVSVGSNSLVNTARSSSGVTRSQATQRHASALLCAEIEPVLQKARPGANEHTLVRSAEPSHKTRTIAQQNATTIVVGVRELNRREDVYCVRVPGINQVYAEGVLSFQCMVWAEELAAWRYMEECWQHMRYGLRTGPWPHAIVSTTPKSRVLIKELVRLAREEPDVYKITKATTDDNPHLPTNIRNMLYADYGGTRIGRQELYADILEDVEGALWSMEEDIAPHRLLPLYQPEDYDRIVVGVDPAAKKGGDHTGIIVAGVLFGGRYLSPQRENAHLSHGFVLGDYSINASPHQWAKQVIKGFRDFDANMVIAEINNGGEMVTHTLRTVDDSLPVRQVHASKGKAIRAEPVAALYQQGRVHHIGNHPELEDQMCSWDAIDPDPGWSPDRMDALVWAMTDLMVGKGRIRSSQRQDARLKGRR